MRVIMLGLFLGMLCCGTASAQSDFLFRGSFSIIGKNQACAGPSPIGEDGLIRLSVAADGQSSAFTLYYPRYAQAFHLTGSLFNTTFQQVLSMIVQTSFSRVTHPVSVRFTQQSPRTIAANTNFLSFVGTIKGYGAKTDCLVSFRAALTKNID